MAKTKKTDHYKKGDIIPAEWIHTDYLEYWLKDFFKSLGCQRILNVCCGDSKFGDIRLDIRADTTRTLEGDLFTLLDYFPPSSVDGVYIDPPFKYYTSGANRFFWQFDALKIAKKVLVTKRPKVTVNLPSKWHSYVIAEDSRPALSLLRIDYK